MRIFRPTPFAGSGGVGRNMSHACGFGLDRLRVPLIWVALMVKRRHMGKSVGMWRTYRMPWTRGMGDWYCVLTREQYVVTRYTRTGVPVRCLAGRFRSDDGGDQVEQLQDQTELAMKRRPKLTGDVGRTPHASYDDLLESFPNYAAWATDASFEDGEPRRGGWASVWAEGNLWHAVLKDSAEGTSLKIVAPTFLMLISLVEHALADPTAPWRVDLPQGRPTPKRKS